MSIEAHRRMMRELKSTLERPNQCYEEVARGERVEPCDKPAVAVRFDLTDGDVWTYPVCARHSRAPMVTLSHIVAAVKS